FPYTTRFRSVRRHPARHVDSDRGDLPGRAGEPDAGQALQRLPYQSERRKRLDQRLLELAYVALDVAAVLLQVEDRIADELARPVVGRPAASVRLDDLHGGVLREVQLGSLVRPASERDDGR